MAKALKHTHFYCVVDRATMQPTPLRLRDEFPDGGWVRQCGRISVNGMLKLHVKGFACNNELLLSIEVKAKE